MMASVSGGNSGSGSGSGTGSSSSSPCAACKFLRRKCQAECVFAPYFPPDQPAKFANVHKVFGASNVTKLLNELHPQQREDAVNSLAYEADMRLRDPVYGCVGVISLLQHQLRQLQIDLTCAKSELSRYQLSSPTATAAAAFNSLLSSSDHHHHHRHHHYQFFPSNLHQVISPDSASLLAQFHHATAPDDRRPVDPS